MKNSEYLAKMFNQDLFTIVYPQEKTQEAAMKLLDNLDCGFGVAKVQKEETGEFIWGVLIDKTKVKKPEGSNNDSNM